MMGNAGTDEKTYLFEVGKTVNMKSDEVQFHPDWPEPIFNDEDFIALKSSIRECGQLIPVLIKKTESGQIVIVDGERRLQAVRELDLPEIICTFIDASEDMTRYVVNTVRKAQTAMQEAEALQNILETEKVKKKELAEMLGKSASTITEITSLAKLPDYIKNQSRHDKRISRAALLRLYNQYDENETEKQIAEFNRVRAALNNTERGISPRAGGAKQYYREVKYPVRRVTGTAGWIENFFEDNKRDNSEKVAAYFEIKQAIVKLSNALEKYNVMYGFDGSKIKKDVV